MRHEVDGAQHAAAQGLGNVGGGFTTALSLQDDFTVGGIGGSVAPTDAGAVGGGVSVRPGRPDLDSLVRAAAADALDSEPPRRLVVAACGPTSLVEAARKAVAAAQREHQCGVSIDFSGEDSHW